jgi:hypothetical protein|tara:strand:- start:44 stop:421 length:378 start_codon:yes stop_codon:yes gene_type:complete
MIEQLITSETANLAKEKKFDWNCHWVLYRGTSSVLHKCDAMPMKGKNLESGDYVLQPTQSLLQKWLREVHNIDVWSQPFVMDKSLPDESYSYFIYKDGIFVKDGVDYIDSEEALEKGLQEALKLI